MKISRRSVSHKDLEGEAYRNPMAPMKENSARTARPRAYHALLRPTSVMLSCRDEAFNNRLHRDLVVMVPLIASVSMIIALGFSTSSKLVWCFKGPGLSIPSGNGMIASLNRSEPRYCPDILGVYAIYCCMWVDKPTTEQCNQTAKDE